jgi:hypothetical protein
LLFVPAKEVSAMPQELIHWSHDYDATSADAARQKKPLLVDFSAAPM